MRQPPLRRFEPDDLLSFKLVSEMILSHDGRWIVYVLEEIDPEADTYSSNLWLISASGGAPRQITFGSDTNESPRFSPDSSQVAFLSDRGGGPAQLHVIRLDGGEARRLTAAECVALRASPTRADHPRMPRLPQSDPCLFVIT